MSEEQEPRQWGVFDSVYRPVGITAKKIKAGIYQFRNNGNGIVANPMDVVTDELIELPDPTCAEVLAGIEKFWSMEERYRQHGLLYKRSVGLYGPPGGGKTATVMLLARRVIAMDGLVILFNGYADDGLELLRKIEPKRRVICIMEDLDDIIDSWESEILSLLDGETQVDGVVYVATTNHYDKLPATLVNRPSRFDEWIEVKMPSPASRAAYLAKVAPQLSTDERVRWRQDTAGFSIAHLKELVAAVLCLEHPYEQVLERLQKMLKTEKAENDE
jgi:SpoVK/Ycf46/Vps4 family AAA+-type ATPase